MEVTQVLPTLLWLHIPVRAPARLELEVQVGLVEVGQGLVEVLVEAGQGLVEVELGLVEGLEEVVQGLVVLG